MSPFQAKAEENLKQRRDELDKKLAAALGVDPGCYDSDLLYEVENLIAEAEQRGAENERERCRLVVAEELGKNAHGFQRPGRVSNATRAVDHALTNVLNGVKKPDIDAFNASRSALKPE